MNQVSRKLMNSQFCTASTSTRIAKEDAHQHEAKFPQETFNTTILTRGKNVTTCADRSQRT